MVRRRRWLSREEFLDYLGATNLIPGPNSTELAIHIGHARAGWSGLLTAGACFILPAALMVAGIAWVYTRFGALPQAAGVLYGIKPVVIAVVVQALWGLSRSALKTRTLAVLCVGAIVGVAAGANELLVLAASAAIMTLTVGGSSRRAASLAFVAPFSGAPAAFGLWPLFAIFLKIGSVLFGSGYVLIAFLRADLVERLHWLTERQLLDAVAVGQITPGPVFTTATFIGYVLGGASGAAVATIGIFLPAFFFVAVSGPFVRRMRRSATAGAALDGVNAASLALIFVVTYQLGRAALVDPLTIAVAIAASVALIRYRVNSAWLVAAGALIGVVSGG